MPGRLEKVTAFVTREGSAGRELMVFHHPPVTADQIASIQLPAGSVEAGELPRDAAQREVIEETGVGGLRMIRELARLQHGFGLVAPVEVGGRRFVRGMWLGAILERERERVRVRIGPPDSGDEGWVPAAAVTHDVRRYLFHLAMTDGGGPRAWPWQCDCGADVTCEWTSLDAVRLDPAQHEWLELVRARLLQAGAAGEVSQS